MTNAREIEPLYPSNTFLVIFFAVIVIGVIGVLVYAWIQEKRMSPVVKAYWTTRAVEQLPDELFTHKELAERNRAVTWLTDTPVGQLGKRKAYERTLQEVEVVKRLHRTVGTRTGPPKPIMPRVVATVLVARRLLQGKNQG